MQYDQETKELFIMEKIEKVRVQLGGEIQIGSFSATDKGFDYVPRGYARR